LCPYVLTSLCRYRAASSRGIPHLCLPHPTCLGPDPTPVGEAGADKIGISIVGKVRQVVSSSGRLAPNAPFGTPRWGRQTPDPDTRLDLRHTGHKTHDTGHRDTGRRAHAPTTYAHTQHNTTRNRHRIAKPRPSVPPPPVAVATAVAPRKKTESESAREVGESSELTAAPKIIALVEIGCGTEFSEFVSLASAHSGLRCALLALARFSLVGPLGSDEDTP
jgi:hypothetical protein